jgi:hypothetical protein
MHLVLTVPVSATEDVKEQYEAAAKRALQVWAAAAQQPGCGACWHFIAGDRKSSLQEYMLCLLCPLE